MIKIKIIEPILIKRCLAFIEGADVSYDTSAISILTCCQKIQEETVTVDGQKDFYFSFCIK